MLALTTTELWGKMHLQGPGQATLYPPHLQILMNCGKRDVYGIGLPRSPLRLLTEEKDSTP